ncbi:hypothetical protein DSL72_001768 [Monilinia vaccinii-corymbosi]|uniref:Uncharacterized protein n=1 Tax=Monilinia vaccinii-corymbosi TaxID=61207 RepID=A0A8A3PAS5_9HELO|nr:hypothetical protein DSL72_001768 [Monilinia vaccinii-corymbosi]
MANHHHHPSTSISRARLTQSLPPLPLEDILPCAPYHDDPAGEDAALVTERTDGNQAERNEPPEYEPMHDYLASRVHRLSQMRPPQYMSLSQDHTHDIPLQHQEPYRDDPFIITIDPNQPPPPSYETLYVQTQTALDVLNDEIDPDIGHAEDVFKWLVSMVLITLTIVAVGFAFNWGHPF